MRSLRGSIFTIKGQNVWLWGAGLLSLILTSLVVLIAPIANIFGMVAIGIDEYLIAMGLGLCIIPIVEIVKLVHRLIDKAKEKKNA
jgi:Ca2+-transporting ATPase